MLARSAILVATVLAASAVPRLWHNHLVKSAPAANDSLTTPPTEVRLWFAEAVLPEVSSIGITTADGAQLPMTKVKAGTDSRSIVSEVSEPLRPGTYKVAWKTKGDDIHQVKGTYKFTLR